MLCTYIAGTLVFLEETDVAIVDSSARNVSPFLTAFQVGDLPHVDLFQGVGRRAATCIQQILQCCIGLRILHEIITFY